VRERADACRRYRRAALNIAAVLFARGSVSASIGTFVFALRLDDLPRMLMVLAPVLLL
jgi:hypothetical protein